MPYWIGELLLSLGVGKALQIGLARLWTLPEEWRVPLWLVISGMIFCLATFLLRRYGRKDPLSPQETSLSTLPSNSFLKAIAATPGRFDANDFFKHAYYSPLQLQAENSFRLAANENSPKDRETFYLNVLSLGSIGYIYDQIWWPLYRSQLVGMMELNQNQGLLPLSRFKAIYEEAASHHPNEYGDITFDNWVSYLVRQQLILIHPSEMVEITVKGKDFLRYLLHTGRHTEMKRM